MRYRRQHAGILTWFNSVLRQHKTQRVDALPIRLLGTMAGMTSAAFTICKTGQDALFFQDQGLLHLSLAYLGIGLASLPASFL